MVETHSRQIDLTRHGCGVQNVRNKRIKRTENITVTLKDWTGDEAYLKLSSSKD